MAWVQGSYPKISQVHAKAAATRSMQYWLRAVTATAATAPAASERVQQRAALFEALCQADTVMRQSGRHMSAEQQGELARRFEQALLLYNSLAAIALAQHRRVWKLLPKHHALTHIAYDNAGVNPRSVHCYPDEDMVGRMKRVYVRCHGRTAPERGLQRYMLLAALRWRRQLRASRSTALVPAAAARAPALTAPAASVRGRTARRLLYAPAGHGGVLQPAAAAGRPRGPGRAAGPRLRPGVLQPAVAARGRGGALQPAAARPRHSALSAAAALAPAVHGDARAPATAAPGLRSGAKRKWGV